MTVLRQIVTGELGEQFYPIFAGANWLVTGVMTMAALILSSSALAMGVVIGGVIANLNTLGLKRDCHRSVRWGSMGAYYGGMAVRMGLIALAVTVTMLFFREHVSPVGLFVGLSAPIINFYILVLGMVIYRFRFKEAS